jgi:mono/diheme cytochrome c family protein
MRSVIFALSIVLVACSKPAKVDADASPSTSTGSNAGTSVDARAILVNGCLSCHSDHMLLQQRLTHAQWQKVVTKMVGWGANVEPGEVAPLVAYLAASYGPDGGAYDPDTLTAAEALSELAVLPDDPFPAGEGERGKPLFVDKCSGCHGADARGAIGVSLVDRPFLYRASDFAKTVRRGRGKMLPIALTDAQIGDVLAHLRTLKNAPP